jgi:hypothetical protein
VRIIVSAGLKKQDVVWSSLSKTRLPKQRLYLLSRRLHQLHNEALCRPYGSRTLGKITSGVTAQGCANKTRKIVSYRKWICRKQSNQRHCRARLRYRLAARKSMNGTPDLGER